MLFFPPSFFLPSCLRQPSHRRRRTKATTKTTATFQYRELSDACSSCVRQQQRVAQAFLVFDGHKINQKQQQQKKKAHRRNRSRHTITCSHKHMLGLWHCCCLGDMFLSLLSLPFFAPCLSLARTSFWRPFPVAIALSDPRSVYPLGRVFFTRRPVLKAGTWEFFTTFHKRFYSRVKHCLACVFYLDHCERCFFFLCVCIDPINLTKNQN